MDLSINPSKEELTDLALALHRIWQLDINRLVPGEDYTIDLQEGKYSREEGDFADNPLFSSLDERALSRPTYKAFIALLDNYEPDTGVQETVTREEIQENNTFLNEILQTAPMRYCHKYLAKKGLVSADPAQFKKTLWDTWFKLYRRDTSGDSSAFEHVFVGEFRHGQVIGFHNWINFYLLEKAGQVDYRGFILPRRKGRERPKMPTGNEHVLSIQLSWQGELKPISTMFIGVSPEFEVAIYTMCWFAGREDNHVEFDGVDLNIKCHTMGQNRMGACYPIAE